jgi:hypothetical protein
MPAPCSPARPVPTPAPQTRHQKAMQRCKEAYLANNIAWTRDAERYIGLLSSAQVEALADRQEQNKADAEKEARGEAVPADEPPILALKTGGMVARIRRMAGFAGYNPNTAKRLHPGLTYHGLLTRSDVL